MGWYVNRGRGPEGPMSEQTVIDVVRAGGAESCSVAESISGPWLPISASPFAGFASAAQQDALPQLPTTSTRWVLWSLAAIGALVLFGAVQSVVSVGKVAKPATPPPDPISSMTPPAPPVRKRPPDDQRLTRYGAAYFLSEIVVRVENTTDTSERYACVAAPVCSIVLNGPTDRTEGGLIFVPATGTEAETMMSIVRCQTFANIFAPSFDATAWLAKALRKLEPNGELQTTKVTGRGGGKVLFSVGSMKIDGVEIASFGAKVL